MQVLHDRFADDPSVSVLAVHYDERGEPAAYLDEHGYTFPAVLNGGAVIAERFDVHALPTFLVIGAEGTVVYRHVGAMSDGIRDEIEGVARAGP